MDARIYWPKAASARGFRRLSGSLVHWGLLDRYTSGQLADALDCPRRAPRARELVAPIDAFHDQARHLGVPIIHVRTILRKAGVGMGSGLPTVGFEREYFR